MKNEYDYNNKIPTVFFLESSDVLIYQNLCNLPVGASL